MKKVHVLSLFLLLAGCAPQLPVRPAIQDTEIYRAPFDKTWSAAVETILERSLPIALVDKSNGIITTQPVIFASGSGAHVEIDRLAVRPSTPFLGTWITGRYTISVFVARLDSNQTRVRITTHIEAYESNSEYQWFECFSKGIIEDGLFKSITAKL